MPHGWALCDGNNGTPNLMGRFLEGSTANIRQFKESGLPNITGSTRGTDVQYGWSGTGAFYVSEWGNYNDYGGSYHATYPLTMSFDASRSSPIYGRSNTVQPNSYTVYYIMRIK